jgi:hypothetical protein
VHAVLHRACKDAVVGASVAQPGRGPDPTRISGNGRCEMKPGVPSSWVPS